MKPIYMIDGRAHQECDCDQFSAVCPKGRKRDAMTAGFNRCYLPVPAIIGDGVVVTVGNDSASKDRERIRQLEEELDATKTELSLAKAGHNIKIKGRLK